MAKIVDKRLKLILFVAILVGLIASLVVGCQRVKAEKTANQAVVALEWNQLKDVAARQGATVADTIAYLKDYEGKNLLNAVVFKEPALLDLINNGTLQVMTGIEIQGEVNAKNLKLVDGNVSDIKTNYNYVLCSDKVMQEDLYRNLKFKTYAVNSMITFKTGTATVYGVATSLPYVDITGLGVGFPQADMNKIRSSNLQLIAQVRTWPKVDQESIDFVFDSLESYGVVAVGFNDPELPGVNQENWPEMAKALAAKLEQHQWPLLSAEFFAQNGLNAVASKMDFNVARMHPVSEAELAKFSTQQIVDRFQLATSERNMGIALVRVYSKLNLQENAAFLSQVTTAIEDKGTTLGSVGVVPNMNRNIIVLILGALAVAAGAVPLLARFGLKKWSLLLPVAAFVVAVLLMIIGQASLAQKLLGLAAVVIYPTLGVVFFASEKPQTIKSAILSFLAITGVSLIGALLVVGMMSTSSYMSAITIFSGIKAGQVLPLLLLFCLYWYKACVSKGYSESPLALAKNIAKKPVTLGLMILGVMALAILALFMLRSGNDAVAVSGFERTFRSVMDQLMVVRPRTKEFLFAHPLMILALYYGYANNRWPLLVFGAIGQVSLVNTFEHLHTPIWVSLLRTFNGLVLGIVLGVILIFVAKFVISYLKKHRQASTPSGETTKLL